MPSLDPIVEKLDLVGLPAGGNLTLDPPMPGRANVLLRRLFCWLRVPPIPGARVGYLDTGAPLSVFPHRVWHHEFHWQAGRDYEELFVAGVGSTLRGQVLDHTYPCRLAQLKVPIELAGGDLKAERLRIDSLVCLLADPGGPSFIILGLWGGVFEGRRLSVDRLPGSDDLAARLDW